MFTGIIQGLGEIAAREHAGSGAGDVRFRVRPLFSMPNLVKGESIALNGACLTVEAFSPDSAWYTCYASAETLRATTLDSLKIGSRVNLERALNLGDSLGGHLVSGHVDGVAKVLSVKKSGESHSVELSAAVELTQGIIPKGSVTLDGVSLTVNESSRESFSVNIIPETWNATALCGWTTGCRVNIETDMIGKYVARFLAPWAEHNSRESGLTLDFLREHGF